MKKIFVGNLAWTTTEQQLRDFFERYGQVLSAKIITDQMTGRSKGFGFVEMADAPAASQAIEELNGQMLGDRPLRISLAQERESRPAGDRGAGRGDRNNGGYGRDSYNRSNSRY